MEVPILEVNNLTRRYGGLIAVNDVSFKIKRGELVGLMGPNGAGKTTLFNLISGYAEPSSGTIKLGGETIIRQTSTQIAKRGVSRTFQNLRVFPTMSVFDNVSVGAIGALNYQWWRAILPFDLGRRDEAVADRTWAALKQTRLADVAEVLASQLPYGQRKYLEIARALPTQPNILFLDQPAAGLNDSETKELASFIRKIHAEGTTVIVVEHNIGFMMTLCKRIICLASGQMIADGLPAEVSASPEVRRMYLGEDYECA
jgi:branched-chain amino acid transport system ATP-binding protein